MRHTIRVVQCSCGAPSEDAEDRLHRRYLRSSKPRCGAALACSAQRPSGALKRRMASAEATVVLRAFRDAAADAECIIRSADWCVRHEIPHCQATPLDSSILRGTLPQSIRHCLALSNYFSCLALNPTIFPTHHPTSQVVFCAIALGISAAIAFSDNGDERHLFVSQYAKCDIHQSQACSMPLPTYPTLAKLCSLPLHQSTILSPST